MQYFNFKNMIIALRNEKGSYNITLSLYSRA